MKRSFRGVSGEETLKACFKVTETAINMLKASIRNENPGYSEEEVEAEMARVIEMQREEKDKFVREFYAGRG